MHDLFDELPLVAVALAVFPIALLMVEMGIVAILAPAVWLLRRWSGRQALMVVTAPSGVVVQTPLTAEGRTVARRRGAVTDPFDELPEQQTVSAMLADDPTLSCAGPGQPIIRRRRPIPAGPEDRR